MDEFFELEKKCKKMKLKKVLKAFVLIIVVSCVGLYLFMQSKQNHKKEVNKTIVQKEINKTIIQKEVNKTIIQKEVKQSKIPKWNVEINLDEINITTLKAKEVNKKNVKKIAKPKIVKKAKQIFKVETITLDKALKLAKFYYNTNDYTSSIKWCKIASNIDNENEEIWGLYALNLEQLNQKEKAIQVLKTYLKYKKSPKLEFILKRLEK